MKRIIYLLLCAFPMLLSCNNEKESDELTEYYVRYEYEHASSDPTKGATYANKIISVKTDSGILDITTLANSYSETFGPVQKGFEAKISVSYLGSSGWGDTTLKIYVARGNEPFALKPAVINGYTATYTIDF